MEFAGRGRMKIFQQIGLGAIVGCATLSFAQSSPSPDNTPAQAASAQLTAPEAAPSPTATVPVEPPSLIPPNILPGPGALALPQIPAAADLQMLNGLFKQSSLGKVADEYRLHLQMVRLETRIRNDAELQAERASAGRVPTDLEKRKRLKEYYHQYYDRLRTMADTPDLKTYLDTQEAGHVAQLAQPRVRPGTNPAPDGAVAKALPTPVQARASNAQRHP
jgi:hypothetical protein